MHWRIKRLASRLTQIHNLSLNKYFSSSKFAQFQLRRHRIYYNFPRLIMKTTTTTLETLTNLNNFLKRTLYLGQIQILFEEEYKSTTLFNIPLISWELKWVTPRNIDKTLQKLLINFFWVKTICSFKQVMCDERSKAIPFHYKQANKQKQLCICESSRSLCCWCWEENTSFFVPKQMMNV